MRNWLKASRVLCATIAIAASFGLPALAQQLDPAHHRRPLGQQVREDDHQPAVRLAIGDAAQHALQVGLLSR